MAFQIANVESISEQIRLIDEKLAHDISAIEDRVGSDIEILRHEAGRQIADLRARAEQDKRSQIDEATRLVQSETDMLVNQIQDLS